MRSSGCAFLAYRGEFIKKLTALLALLLVFLLAFASCDTDAETDGGETVEGSESTGEDETTEPADDSPEDKFAFISDGNGTCSVAYKGVCKEKTVIIPPRLPRGDKVTSIRAGAFLGSDTLTIVKITE